MDLISRVLLLGVVLLAGILLFTPAEPYLEAAIALSIVATALVGFLMHPGKEVFYVRTSVKLVDADLNQTLEHDYVAVRVELVRLWILFLPTFLAVAFLVFFLVAGPSKFSVLNWTFSHEGVLVVAAMWVFELVPLFVLALLSSWISERRVMRHAEACRSRSYSISRAPFGKIGRVSYLFMGEGGQYCGGDCRYFGFSHPPELASVVFHNVRKPDLNKIAMGFVFHRFIVLSRGVTDLDMHSASARAALAETTS